MEICSNGANMQGLRAWLQFLRIEKYYEQLHAMGLDARSLAQLSDADLAALGLPLGPRKKIRLNAGLMMQCDDGNIAIKVGTQQGRQAESPAADHPGATAGNNVPVLDPLGDGTTLSRLPRPPTTAGRPVSSQPPFPRQQPEQQQVDRQGPQHSRALPAAATITSLPLQGPAVHTGQPSPHSAAGCQAAAVRSSCGPLAYPHHIDPPRPLPPQHSRPRPSASAALNTTDCCGTRPLLASSSSTAQDTGHAREPPPPGAVSGCVQAAAAGRPGKLPPSHPPASNPEITAGGKIEDSRSRPSSCMGASNADCSSAAARTMSEAERIALAVLYPPCGAPGKHPGACTAAPPGVEAAGRKVGDLVAKVAPPNGSYQLQGGLGLGGYRSRVLKRTRSWDGSTRQDTGSGYAERTDSVIRPQEQQAQLEPSRRQLSCQVAAAGWRGPGLYAAAASPLPVDCSFRPIRQAAAQALQQQHQAVATAAESPRAHGEPEVIASAQQQPSTVATARPAASDPCGTSLLDDPRNYETPELLEQLLYDDDAAPGAAIAATANAPAGSVRTGDAANTVPSGATDLAAMGGSGRGTGEVYDEPGAATAAGTRGPADSTVSREQRLARLQALREEVAATERLLVSLRRMVAEEEAALNAGNGSNRGSGRGALPAAMGEAAALPMQGSASGAVRLPQPEPHMQRRNHVQQQGPQQRLQQQQRLGQQTPLAAMGQTMGALAAVGGARGGRHGGWADPGMAPVLEQRNGGRGEGDCPDDVDEQPTQQWDSGVLTVF
ncbi:hypothetical protein Agub_g107 [Astrephomene gubernaculifera]|uniref:SAM domain-containing protein n=1 Tax=Astrephomene gubernaculifera TaxID=47775 RepID=A0AAD3DD72_9CHLO|nr:hypothetical protein Agub_g107 [Astrephomene gubernaculifera]